MEAKAENLLFLERYNMFHSSRQIQQVSAPGRVTRFSNLSPDLVEFVQNLVTTLLNLVTPPPGIRRVAGPMLTGEHCDLGALQPNSYQRLFPEFRRGKETYPAIHNVI